jgi:hypothetical protein
MSPTLTETLLALVAAIHDDGGQEVRRLLRDALHEAYAFDGAELLVLSGSDLVRFWLAEPIPAVPIVGLDAVEVSLHSGEPVRIDEIAEADRWPATRSSLVAGGFSSALVLPFEGPGVPGVVALARRYAWAFAGAPLRALRPLVGMAGLCHGHALALSVRGSFGDLEGSAAAITREAGSARELGRLRQELDRLNGDLNLARREVDRFRAEARAAESALESARNRVRDLEAARGAETNENAGARPPGRRRRR